MSKTKEKSSEELYLEIERLKKELKKKKKYGLVWEEKPEDVVEMCKDKLPVLKEVKNKEIITEKKLPINILIEGDNYHALSTLNITHKRKIDVIYIDPPYNTGNKDFKFNDNWVDREDSYRHSKWLSFIKHRLMMTKNLLKKTGAIFISIDDNEVAQLKMLCDEIFLEKNFLAKINRITSKGSKNDSKYFVSDNDYILVYAKNKPTFNVNPISINIDTSKFTKKDNKGYFKPRNLEMSGSGQDTLQHRPKMGYSIYYNAKTKDIKLLFDYDLKKKPVYLAPDKTLLRRGYVCYRPKLNKGKLGRWRWGSDKFLNKLDDIFIDSVKKRIYTKDREKSHALIAPNCNLEILNTEGTKELSDIFGKKVFDFPKPSRLIEYIIDRNPNKNSIILDFFSGTGTTGHAVLSLNKKDQGNRQFIIVTDNENNICSKICYPRLMKVIKGYKNNKGIKIKGLGGNLKYYTTDFVDIKPTDKNKKILTIKATELLCIKEDTFEEVKTRNKYFRVFKNKNQYTGIIYDILAIDDFKIFAGKIDGKFSVYIFSLSDETYEDEFEDMKNKIKVSPIPESILQVYRRLIK